MQDCVYSGPACGNRNVAPRMPDPINLSTTNMYFRFHLQHEREANEKFLEAMLLIADVKEATETKAEQSVITSHNTLS